MTPERHTHYTAAMEIIERLGPAKLQPEERETLTDAAEGLLLTNDPEETERLREQAREQLEALIASGRWSEKAGEQLLSEILAAGLEPVAA